MVIDMCPVSGTSIWNSVIGLNGFGKFLCTANLSGMDERPSSNDGHKDFKISYIGFNCDGT